MALNNEPLTHMTVFPEQGEIKDVAKLLLALADSPRDVMTTLDPGLGFRIPTWLYESFVAVWDSREAGASVLGNGDMVLTVLADDVKPDDQPPAVPASSYIDNVEPVKRRPGRPRKGEK